jgi:NAD+ kinase
VKKFILSPNPYRDKGFRAALQTEKILQQAGVQTRICLPFTVDKNFELPPHMRLCDLNRELPGADMLVCFGGDGTILHASKLATANKVPILSVNVGTMGFMAELETKELQLLERAVKGQYRLDERMMLDVQVLRGTRVVYEDCALNDAVVSKGAVARVVQMNVSCDDVEVYNLSGDGVIISTPTGSTAYSMSSGGPIVEPESRNIIITPICVHALQSRSIVLSPQRVVTVKVGKIGRKNAYLTVDGGRAFRLEAGDVVRAASSAHVTQLVRVKDSTFFDVVNQKFKNK